MKKVLILICALLVMMLGVTAVNAEEAQEAKLENVALDKTVYAKTEVAGDVASLEGTAWFSAAWITDGEVPVWGGPEDQETHICWYGGSVKQDTDIMLYIELEDDYDITEVRLYPTTFLDGANMPSVYEIVISDDGDEWTVVAKEEGIVAGQTYSEPFVYQVNQRAAYVGVHVLKASSVKDQNYYYSGLGEVEVIAAVMPKTPRPTAEPTEPPAEATDAPADVTDAPADVTDAPAGATEKAAETDEGNSNTGLIIGIVAGVVVVAAVIAGIIIAKNKKK